MTRRPVIDVTNLPSVSMTSREPLWWGVAGLIAIEATMFALLFASYFYLRGNAIEWPPPDSRLPFALGTANLLALLVSAATMHLVNREAMHHHLRPARKWLIVTTVLSLAILVLRGLELYSMSFKWNEHAYGSVVWLTTGLHTFHLLASNGENLLFLFLLFRGPVEEKHMLDLRLNGMYWYFIVASWVPFYVSFYLDPGLWP